MVHCSNLQSTSLNSMSNGLLFQGSTVHSLQLIASPKLLIIISCMQAPIYVNKQIVLADAIRMGYGMGRVRDTKATYDVLLDSAADGPDLLTEELDLVRNMDLAVKEERYHDAAMLRDKLMKLRNSSHSQ
ncbi:hypothetical protein QUC31_002742 [Theobroma cacao]